LPTAKGVVDAADDEDLRPEDEFTWFFRSEYAAVVRTVTLITHDPEVARDVAQEAFIQLLRHWRKVSRYDRPDAWVRRVAIRAATRTSKRDLLRVVKERQVFDTDGRSDPRPDGDVVDVVGAIRQLPPSQRAAVVLYYFEDRPMVEIADILGCAEATVKVHLYKARRRLALLLGERAHDVG
jgi:RNA polymerase sigma-70 factor (sigma-E family)